MYRVYDKVKQRWILDDVYIAPNNDIFILKKNMFGRESLKLVSDRKYFFHRDINFYDKNGKLIFEGDICKIYRTDSEVVGLIAYATEHASYYLFDEANLKYYQLNADNTDIEIIGNIFDNNDLLPTYNNELDNNE